MDPGPEDYARMLHQRRAEMERSRAFARYAHSRTGLLMAHLRNLVERVDPTGRDRQQVH
jgi:hypothetical protein